MKNLIGIFCKKYLIVTFILIGNITFSTACSKPEKNGSSNSQSENTTLQNQMSGAGNFQANVKDPAEKVSTPQTDIVASLKKGADYQKIIRPKILAAGWQPSPEEDADKCGSGDDTCDKFPEMNHCAGTGLGNCEFRWEKDGKILLIYTVDQPQIYDSYKIEKSAPKTSSAAAQNAKWNEFWDAFKNAVNKKDKEKLKSLMTEKIDGGGDIETSEQRIAAIEESNMWSSMQKTVAGGTKAEKCDKPCRVTKDGYLIFTYEKSDWKWSGLGGEGGE